MYLKELKCVKRSSLKCFLDTSLINESLRIVEKYGAEEICYILSYFRNSCGRRGQISFLLHHTICRVRNEKQVCTNKR